VARHPDDVITYRDLRQTPVPHVTEDWIAASFTAQALTSEMAELLKFSDELVDEFLAADRCVFSVPMYNFSIPSNFKAYIDQVVRVGRTFMEENGQVKGLAVKKVLFITSRGVEFEAGSPYEGWDSQEPALGMLFNGCDRHSVHSCQWSRYGRRGTKTGLTKHNLKFKS